MGSEQAIRTLCEDGDLVAECRRVMPQLALMAAPALRDGVRMALQPLVLVFGVSEAAKAPGFWEVYFDALQDFPLVAVKLAVSDYAKGPESEFFPKPGPLRKLAADHATVPLRAHSRARAVAGTALAPRERTAKSPAEVARVKAMLADYVAQVEAKRVPGAAYQPPPPKTDAQGLTAEMRASMAREP